jgi:hypothetical protein
MKQGSTDDPFAEEPTDERATAEAEADERPPDGAESGDATDTDPSASPPAARHGGSDRSDAVEQRTLPYIHAREGVKDGRSQRPVFLRDHVESGIDDLVAEMEGSLGEDVYKTDVTEAAMVVAQANPDLVRETLEEWGYGWS